jgi:hypothetical protein
MGLSFRSAEERAQFKLNVLHKVETKTRAEKSRGPQIGTFAGLP